MSILILAPNFKDYNFNIEGYNEKIKSISFSSLFFINSIFCDRRRNW